MAGVDGPESQPSGNAGNAAIETMTLSERRAILSSMCGVVSVISKRAAADRYAPRFKAPLFCFRQEHTGRMCTRSLRCPQHTDSQRKYVRQTMLDAPEDGSALVADKEKDMIDVDTWEEGDSLASLLTAQVSAHCWFYYSSVNQAPFSRVTTSRRREPKRRRPSRRRRRPVLPHRRRSVRRRKAPRKAAGRS